MTEEAFYEEILPQVIKEELNKKKFSHLKQTFSQKHGLMFSNTFFISFNICSASVRANVEVKK